MKIIARMLAFLAYLLALECTAQVAITGQWTATGQWETAVNNLSGPGSGGGGFTANALSYTSGNYLLHSGELTGTADSKQAVISLWFNSAGSDGVIQEFLVNGSSGANTHFFLQRSAQNNIVFRGSDSSGTLCAGITNTTTILAGSGWHHIIASIDTANRNGSTIALDGSTNGSYNIASAFNNVAMDIANSTAAGWFVSFTAGFGMNGCQAELAFYPGYWLDLSNASNIQLFRTTGGAPVDLGSDGTEGGLLPAPLIYFRSGTAGVNAGTGGNLTVVGSVPLCGNHP